MTVDEKSPQTVTQSIEQTGASVELCGLTVRIGDRILLQDAHVRFAAGKIALIVGRSGAGKSVLLRTIAGLNDGGEITTSGSVTYGAGTTKSPPIEHTVGIVFQQFALFDELTPAENVRFAFAHRRREHRNGEARSGVTPHQLLGELEIPQGVRTASLSGGQRQRLAIARTLANDPDVVLYDEPTAGLDQVTATRVARLIQATHASHPKTSIVVTHDYATLAAIADQIFLLDPDQRSLRPVERERWNTLHEMLRPHDPRPPEPAADQPLRRSKSSKLGGAVVRSASRFFESTSRLLEQMLVVPWRLVPSWRSAPWGLRFLMHYLRLVCGPSAWAYVLMAGVIAGFVATYFTFRFLPYRPYTEPLIVENLLHALGFSLYRILVPVLVTILIAARCGAAVASDVGAKVYGQQVSAMRTLNADPGRYLHSNILFAFLVGTPLLVLLAFLAARATSVVVFTVTHPQFGPFFWETHFHRELVTPGSFWYRGSGWLIGKLLLSAVGIASIAHYFGSTPKHSGRDVSFAITATIFWATLFVLGVNFVFAFLEFDHGSSELLAL